MSNGFDNPYLTTEDTSLDFLDLFGQAQNLLRADQTGVSDDWDLDFGPEYDFEWGMSQLSPEAQQAILEILPSQMYTYEGISPEIMSALGNVFGEGGVDLMGLHETILPDLIGPGGAGGDNLEHPLMMHEYWYDPVGPGNAEWQWGMPLLTDLQTEGLPFTNIFDPSSLAETMTQLAYGSDYEEGVSDEIRAGEVRALTSDMIDKTKSAYYAPYEESEREDFVTTLGKNIGKVSTGGFAGSDIRTGGIDIARGGYDDSYADLLAQIEKMKGSSTGDIMDIIYGWQEQMSELT